MEKILGISLHELSLLTVTPPRFGAPEEEIAKAQAKGIHFGESVFMRELLNYLPMHRCNRGCDSIELSVAEMVAAKRPLNPHALRLFAQRLNYYTLKANDEMTKIMQENGWNLAQYLEHWANGFIMRGVDVLHGELPPEELFGNGYALETWTRLTEFLGEVEKAEG